jgi:tetratricopeptide (TPR) repeat protein
MNTEFAYIYNAPLYYEALALEQELLSTSSEPDHEASAFETMERAAQSYCILEDFTQAMDRYRVLADQAALGGFIPLALAAQANEAFVLGLEALASGQRRKEGLDKAYKLLFHLLEESRSLKLPKQEARVLAKLGMVAGFSGWLSEGEAWLRQAVQAEKTLKRPAFTAEARLHLAENLLDQDRMAEAEMEARAAHELALDSGEIGLQSSAAWTRGRVFEGLAHWREAAVSYRECIDLDRRICRERTLRVNTDLLPEGLPSSPPLSAEEPA